jgi:hypothetical protein
MYTLWSFGKMNFARPEIVSRPGRRRMPSSPRETRARFAVVVGSVGPVSPDPL